MSLSLSASLECVSSGLSLFRTVGRAKLLLSRSSRVDVSPGTRLSRSFALPRASPSLAAIPFPVENTAEKAGLLRESQGIPFHKVNRVNQGSIEISRERVMIERA